MPYRSLPFPHPLRLAGGLLAIMFVLGLAGAAAAETTAQKAQALRARAGVFQPIPQEINQLRGKPLNPHQVELGRMLFFEPRLSRSHVITCATCHSLTTGGADNVPASVGHGWQKGPRNSPTVLNAVFNAAQFWDGRAPDLAEQAKGPIQTMVEMNNSPERVVKTLASIPEYVERFREAFPEEKTPISFETVARAIEAFEATLITPNSRFDRFLAGDDSALSDHELEGLRLFMDTGCVACHAGRNLGGQAYFPFGVIERPGPDIVPEEDKGRFAVTRTPTDEYVFRAAPLRNVELTAPYFHSGNVWDLKQAVAIMGTAQLGRAIDDREAEAITAFLRTLTGDPPRVTLPVLPPSTPDTPRPEH